MFPLHAAAETSKYMGKIIFQQLGYVLMIKFKYVIHRWELGRLFTYDVHGKT